MSTTTRPSSVSAHPSARRSTSITPTAHRGVIHTEDGTRRRDVPIVLLLERADAPIARSQIAPV